MVTAGEDSAEGAAGAGVASFSFEQLATMSNKPVANKGDFHFVNF